MSRPVAIRKPWVNTNAGNRAAGPMFQFGVTAAERTVRELGLPLENRCCADRSCAVPKDSPSLTWPATLTAHAGGEGSKRVCTDASIWRANMLGTDTAVEIQTHTTAKRPTERNSVGDTSPFVHLYEIVLRRASTWPTAIAIGGQEGLTWKTLNGRQLLELVDLLAQELAGEGVAAGDRVVTWLPNHWRTSVYLFALWKLGAVVVPFDREMNPEAAARIIQSVSPRCVLVGYAERPQWLRDAPLVEWWGPGSRISDSPVPDTWAVPDETLATISFTSGTTGEPKGCMHYARQFVFAADRCARPDSTRTRVPGWLASCRCHICSN